MSARLAAYLRRSGPSIAAVVVFVGSLYPVATSSAAQPDRARETTASVGETGRHQAGVMRRDPEIRRMVRAVNDRRIERSVRTLASFGTRNTLSSQTDPDRGIGAARDWIHDQFQHIARSASGRMTVEKQSFVQPESSRIPEPTVITNVVATLRGTQDASSDRVYVISGHYDSICSDPTDAECDAPGANDDASGVAAVLEAARVMAPYEFDATIIFMAVAGEEQGLYGSTHFADQANEDGLDIHAMFTNDIVGNTLGGNGVRDRKRVRVFSEGVPTDETEREAAIRRAVGGENDSSSRQLARYIDSAAEAYTPNFDVWMIYRRDRFLRGGDQIPFLANGYPAVRFTEPNENYDHQHQDVRVEDGVQFGDLPRFVDFGYIARVTRVDVAALGSLARAPAAPTDAGILTDRLTNDTDLRWDAASEPDIAGYEVVWRDTTAETWTHSRRIGNVTNFTAEGMSKDNFFFGVRAVDQDGHRSPVSFPQPVF